MNISGGTSKLIPVVLSIACIGLIANLVREYRGMQPAYLAQASWTRAYRPRPMKTASRAAPDLAQYDPTVHFDELRTLDSRTLSDEKRNPFEFVGEAAPPPTVAKAPSTPPQPPPPPPPPPLKAVGYNDLPGGQKEAMVEYNGDVNVVHEGDTIGSKYRVVSITSALVVVLDASTQQKIELPVPQ